jgi:hypothetical protein
MQQLALAGRWSSAATRALKNKYSIFVVTKREERKEKKEEGFVIRTWLHLL